MIKDGALIINFTALKLNIISFLLNCINFTIFNVIGTIIRKNDDFNEYSLYLDLNQIQNYDSYNWIYSIGKARKILIIIDDESIENPIVKRIFYIFRTEINTQFLIVNISKLSKDEIINKFSPLKNNYKQNSQIKNVYDLPGFYETVYKFISQSKIINLNKDSKLTTSIVEKFLKTGKY